MRAIIVLFCLLVAGFGYAAEGDYTVPAQDAVTDIEDVIVEINYGGYLKLLRTEYEALQKQIKLQDRIVAHNVAKRDKAIADGTAAQALKVSLVAERTAIVDKYNAIKAAAEAVVTVNEPVE